MRAGAGLNGSDRITLIWADGVIKKQWLQVTDDGPGMLPDVLQRTGQRFVKSKLSRGSGLGLAIAHSVMTRHGGQVKFSAPTARDHHSVTLEWPCP